MIAVTGATGYIGRAVVAELARRGLDVVAVSRVPGAEAQHFAPETVTAHSACVLTHTTEQTVMERAK